MDYSQLIKYKMTLIKRTRKRLKILHYIKTDKHEYFVYNTETNKEDSVNIEIEKSGSGREIILESEIMEDSFGAMPGDSFNRLVNNSLGMLRKYLAGRGEEIIIDSKMSK